MSRWHVYFLTQAPMCSAPSLWSRSLRSSGGWQKRPPSRSRSRSRWRPRMSRCLRRICPNPAVIWKQERPYRSSTATLRRISSMFLWKSWIHSTKQKKSVAKAKYQSPDVNKYLQIWLIRTIFIPQEILCPFFCFADVHRGHQREYNIPIQCWTCMLCYKSIQPHSTSGHKNTHTFISFK